MAELHLPQDVLRRPWHGACDRADDPAIAAIRLHRAEVQALIDFRRTPPGSEEQGRAWRRLATLRARRVALLPDGQAARLPPLPALPAGTAALTTWQKLRRRIGLDRR